MELTCFLNIPNWYKTQSSPMSGKLWTVYKGHKGGWYEICIFKNAMKK